VAFSIFLCFFFRMRLRRFLISEPMAAGQGSWPSRFCHTRVVGSAAVDDAGERARQLRREGKTIREIQEILGTRSSRLMSEWLRGEPPHPSVRGRRAKVAARERARELRADGWSYNAIAVELGVAKSSVSVWCRDIVLTEEQREALMLPVAEARLKRAATARAMRIRRTEVIQDAAASEIGHVSDRELFLIGVTLYWAEGSKAKPWRTGERVSFINSDVSVVRVCVAWLRLLGLGADDLVFRVAIHETADAGVATRAWAEVLAVDPASFRRPTLKRHKPTTVRQNVGDSYIGCLIVQVRRSTDLNRRIAGWWRGIAAGVDGYAG
jgi:transcriptional regulator with XRE-family HTH domain